MTEMSRVSLSSGYRGDFEHLVNAEMLIAIVQQCLRDLDATPPASPEDVEQLARQRLQDTTDAYTIGRSPVLDPAQVRPLP